jgi:ribonuclease BN (tRNA processing enzyme)
VLAFAFEQDPGLHVRKDRLQRCGLLPGPWLTALKRRLLADEPDALLTLPDGSTGRVRELARELILVTPAKHLVYATDLADTADNRERLLGLARNAHTLFLEAAFTEADRRHALDNGHLTARACGEIAAAAGVARLIPFHLSRRYAADPSALFSEIAAACGRGLLPDPSLFDPPDHAA